MRNLQTKSEGSKLTAGDHSAALYGGIALHGEIPPAIDKTAVLADWRRIWRSVLSQLTPIQLEALRNELAEVDQ
ncbi:MAG: hypothetical protein WD423_07260 [Rhodothermales bacterium]